MRKLVLAGMATIPMLLGTPSAHADPQMLGVIQTASAVPLQCSGDTCAAELTSICLHEARPTPTPGYPYTAHNPEALRVTARRPGGTALVLNPSDVLRFSAGRGFTTVRVSTPKYALEALGVSGLTVSVVDPLTLRPSKPSAASEPLMPSDIELGAGPLRATASGIVDQDTDTMHASEVLARMIDVLPRHGKSPTALRTDVWNSVAVPHADQLSETGRHRAKTAYNRCYRQTRIGDKTLRGCLAEVHDDFVRDLNVEYWDAVKAGS